MCPFCRSTNVEELNVRVNSFDDIKINICGDCGILFKDKLKNRDIKNNIDVNSKMDFYG